jgi:hypothetical protein
MHAIPVTIHLLLLLVDVEAPGRVGSGTTTCAALLRSRQLPHFVLEEVLIIAQCAIDHCQLAQLHPFPLIFRIFLGLQQLGDDL